MPGDDGIDGAVEDVVEELLVGGPPLPGVRRDVVVDVHLGDVELEPSGQFAAVFLLPLNAEARTDTILADAEVQT